MNRAHLFFLLAIACALLAVVFEPALSYPLFGSDSGEYARLTGTLVATGRLPVGGATSGAYNGWGFAYPDFPGTFLLSGAVAQAFGADPTAALAATIPAVAALSVLPLFLLFRRVFPSESVALLGAGLASLAMPRAFDLAHPAPVALGDFLAVGGLWMFVESRRDPRWFAALLPTAGALLFTHHLSSYFFVVSAWGGLLLLELFRPRAWSRRVPTREFAFLAGFSGALVVYWFGYAVDFRTVLASGLATAPGGLALAAGGAAVAIAGAAAASVAALRLRRTRTLRYDREVAVPTAGGLARDMAGLSLALAVGLGVLVVVPLPPTHQRIDPLALAFFLPYLVLVPLTAGSRRRSTATRIGSFGLAWLAAVGVSAALAIATASAVILPSRHAEFLIIPVGLLMAIGFGAWVARLRADTRRRTLALAGGIAVAALVANAAIVYPPPSLFGGFQEGYTTGDAALWMWSGTELPRGTSVASDHRMSSVLFGFAGANGTWQSTAGLFVGTNGSEGALELCHSAQPRAVGSIRAVAVDGTMRSTGVALDPAQPAEPLSASAETWLSQAPFLPVYENGDETVYWVDASCPVSAL